MYPQVPLQIQPTLDQKYSEKKKKFKYFQWLRIHLAMHRTLVQSLVQEDSTATKPARRNYWAHTLEPVRQLLLSPRAAVTEACTARACALQPKTPPQWEPLLSQLEAAQVHHQRPSAAQNKFFEFLKNSRKFQRSKLEFATHQQLFIQHLHCIGHYKYSRGD